jgi:hypothetical protein
MSSVLLSIEDITSLPSINDITVIKRYNLARNDGGGTISTTLIPIIGKNYIITSKIFVNSIYVKTPAARLRGLFLSLTFGIKFNIQITP